MAETAATYTIDQHHVLMFTANVKAALARMGGVLDSTVTQGSYTGDKVQAVNFLGPIVFTERTTRYADTQFVEPAHTQRWLRGAEYDAAILVDRLDTLKMIYDPTSPYVERMREAAARKHDEIVMNAFFASALTGERGESTTAFPAADEILHGTTGLTVAKLRSARKLLKQRHVDLRMERPRIAIDAEGADDLIAETLIQSKDTNAVAPLVSGEVASFMGFDFLPIEEIIPTRTDSGTVVMSPCWVPSGMHKGDWQNLSIMISPRPDKNNIPQIHGTFTCGATRLEEGKVIKVEYKI